MKTTDPIPMCPICHNQVSETAKFCPECGARLAAADLDPAWVAARQEEIKHAKDNDLSYTIFSVVGALIAVAIPFVMRFILKYTMDPLSWLLTIIGILFFIGGYVGVWYDDRKQKALIRQLEAGQK
jgi:endogenous inhibitor of DNA gyrase (YacG/DUF329 family)